MSGYDVIETGGVPVKAWTRGVPIDEGALAQLRNVARLPFIHSHVAAMPDVHWGRGATVGSVIPTLGAIVPAAVGVDIGCGMCAVRTDLIAGDLPDSLAGVRRAIERTVPVGRASHRNLPIAAERAWQAGLGARFEGIEAKYPAIAEKASAVLQIGTLGGGNHFIEVCLDEADRVWLMLHSGSRAAGNRIGSYFIAEARREMERQDIHLPDVDLAYLVEGSTLFDDYVEAVSWAQDYARTNRSVMMEAVGTALSTALGRPVDLRLMAVNCHHNYVAREHHFGREVWLTRKGAVRAGAGELGIVPGSMGAMSFIVRGKGHRESFETCSHGAGRAMSRSEARRRFSLEDHILATARVECRKDAGVIDETPGAYKDIEAVMAAQADLVDIVHRLRQLICVKG
jgi:tRNA-splicing ligase RtcB